MTPRLYVTRDFTVCFNNGGHLGKTTEEITLHLDDPSPPPEAGMWTGLMGRVAFRWQFNRGISR